MMKQALIFTQTLLIFLMPFTLAAFNITLGELTYKKSSLESLSSEISTAFSLSGRKVIKEIENTSNPYQIKTVVIDPGHGGHDPGCSGSSSREKHLALAIGLELEQLLNQKFPGIEVIMTRDKDVFIPLHKRAALANRNQADLFISIHCNYMPGSSATRGTETFVLGLHRAKENLAIAKRENAAILLEEDYEKNYDYDPNSPEGHIMLTMFQSAHLDQSILFAELAEQKMKNTAGRRSRGVKQAGFVVLRETTMPSVLVEAGFLSSGTDQTFLKSSAGQKKIAQSLLEAFQAYKKQVESPEYLPYSEPVPVVASLPGAENASPTGQTKKTSNRSVSKSEAVNPPGYSHKQAVPVAKKVFTNTYIDATKASPTTAKKAAVQFFVQLASSSKLQDTQTEKWQQIGFPVEVVKEEEVYKYRARNFKDLNSARLAKQEIRQKGFPDAFVVAYQNGKRIPMSAALEALKP